MPEETDNQTAPEAEQVDEATAEPITASQRAEQLRALDDETLLTLAEQAAKADHWLDVARRAQAELDNTVKRLRRDAQEDMKYANAGLARDLLPVMDNLSRALKAQGNVQSLAEGVKLTSKQLVEALAKHGITPIDADGRPFDPALHEAVMATRNPNLPNNAVAMELEQGWKMLDRVLRATKVQVNKL
jgi:molecular chaperone GrpE